MTKRTVIRNAQLVSGHGLRHADLLIEGEYIAEISARVGGVNFDEEVDAKGRMLLPGLIDDQVHFREPGFPEKGDMASESRAALLGGITSVLEMPNTEPATTTIELLREKFERASDRMLTNYSFYLGATESNLEPILESLDAGAAGIKVFMGASTGSLLVTDPEALRRIFARAPLPVLVHAEDSPLIDANLRAFVERYGEDIPPDAHPLIRSAEACYRASHLAVSLAREEKTRLHVLHVSTARELELFEPGPLAEKSITAEVCIHHLFFDDRDYARLGSHLKWNPAVKTREDRAELRRGLLCDKLDVIGTDHAPHTLEEKARPYASCPSGGPLVEHALPALLSLCTQGALSVQVLVDKMCHAPAELFGLERRGYLREGYFADLVLVDLNAPWTVERASVLSRVGWSPFEGTTFGARVDSVWVNGTRKVLGGILVSDAPGARLTFTEGRRGTGADGAERSAIAHAIPEPGPDPDPRERAAGG